VFTSNSVLKATDNTALSGAAPDRVKAVCAERVARLDEAMADAASDPSTLGRAFPEDVPVLVDRTAGVTLRALGPPDLGAVVEQCHDPDSIRWTTVPVPEGGYGPAEAEDFLGMVAAGWRSGQLLTWAIEEHARPGVYCGSIDLRIQGDGIAETGFVLHPAARGRHLMSAALRLVRDFAFDVARLRVVRWRAVVGNWSSRRVAAAAGWRFDGTVRRSLVHRGELLDGWVATLLASDPRAPQPWLDPPVLTASGFRLRPFVDTDADRVTEACSDPRTQQWLASLPRPYRREHALVYVGGTREMAAQGTGLVWCVADRNDDRCLASVSLEGFGGYSRRAEIGYWAHPETRARGVVTEAARLVTAYAESHDLVDSLLLRAAATNTASRHVAVSAGYRKVGVLQRAEPLGDGTVTDLVLYARP
jgi:RimJ/RimL family protein N-acetyltransferase